MGLPRVDNNRKTTIACRAYARSTLVYLLRRSKTGTGLLEEAAKTKGPNDTGPRR